MFNHDRFKTNEAVLRQLFREAVIAQVSELAPGNHKALAAFAEKLPDAVGFESWFTPGLAQTWRSIDLRKAAIGLGYYYGVQVTVCSHTGVTAFEHIDSKEAAGKFMDHLLPAITGGDPDFDYEELFDDLNDIMSTEKHERRALGALLLTGVMVQYGGMQVFADRIEEGVELFDRMINDAQFCANTPVSAGSVQFLHDNFPPEVDAGVAEAIADYYRSVKDTPTYPR